MKPSDRMKLGIAWFRPEQWSRLREVANDRDELEESFAEWECSAEENLRSLQAQGLNVEKVVVDVEELLTWCKGRGLSVDGTARASYVAELLRRENLH